MATREERLARLRGTKDSDAVAEDALSYLVRTYGMVPVMPQKGVQYFTEADIQEIVVRVRALLRDGRDGRDGEKGEKGDPGESIVGPRGERGLPGRSIVGENGKDGKNGKDGVSPDIKLVVRQAVEELKNHPVDYKTLKNAPDLKDLPALIAFLKAGGFRGGGGGTATSISAAIITTASTINDANLAFVFPSLPSLLIINGGMYSQTGGAITWTWSAGTRTATLSSPVGTGGSIFGLS